MLHDTEARPGQTVVATVGLDQDQRRELSERHGVAIVDGSARLIVASGLDTDSLAALLAPPARAVLEIGGEDEDFARHLSEARQTTGLYVALTTPTAFAGIDLARAMRSALAARNAIPRHLMFKVELALHETIANALIHGNLFIDANLRRDSDRYPEFCCDLRERLGRHDARARRVSVEALWDRYGIDISVADEGAGYDPSEADGDDGDTARGRGLAIVLSLASRVVVDRGGRRTTLRFDFQNPPRPIRRERVADAAAFRWDRLSVE